MHELNAFLRGWAGYFRYGNSAHHFGAITDYATHRLAGHVAKRHKRPRADGWSGLAFQSLDRLGLIDQRNRRRATPTSVVATETSRNAGGEERR